MKTETKKTIYHKLLQIQQKVNGLAKDKKGFNYAYVTGSKVLGEIKPFMNELGLLLKQEVLSIENSRQDYQSKNGTKSEILSKVMMRFTWIDTDTGEKDENLFGANGQNDWEKGLGSALTYAERYFLLKYFHISTDEDDIDNDQRKTESTFVEKPNGTSFNIPPIYQKKEVPIIEDRSLEGILNMPPYTTGSSNGGSVSFLSLSMELKGLKNDDELITWAQKMQTNRKTLNLVELSDLRVLYKKRQRELSKEMIS